MAEKPNSASQFLEAWVMERQAGNGELSVEDLATDFYLKVRRRRKAFPWMGIVTGTERGQQTIKVFLSESQSAMLASPSYGRRTAPVVDAYTLLAIALEREHMHSEIHRVPISPKTLEQHIRATTAKTGQTLAYTEDFRRANRS